MSTGLFLFFGLDVTKKKKDPYGDTLISIFEGFDIDSFHVMLTPPKIFICGGPYNTGQLIPQSLRERIVNFLDSNDEELFNASIQAEDFKDYFKDGAYLDLLEFEEDIANISTLIIICLESPGSLVELGMFCNNDNSREKLLVIAPQEEVQAEDSFIFLGPLKSLLSLDAGSVVVYPQPDKKTLEYEHMPLIYKDITEKLKKTDKSSTFNIDNSAHIALLIYEIVRQCYPMKVGEIELALMALDLDVSEGKVSRLLYLLEKIELIKHLKYSNSKYYFVEKECERRVKFGKTKDGKKLDSKAISMAMKQSYILAEDEVSKKRIYALKQVVKLQKGAEE